MTVRIVLGAPASGKTAWMIERILEVKAQNCFAPVWALVPDSSKVGYLRHRIALAGGSVGVKVATFGSFYADLLERSGQFVPIMPTIMDNRIVSETISLAHQKGILKEFANIREKPGLMQVLQDAFAELRGGMVQPSELLASAYANPLEKEIGELYSLYLDSLAELNWSDQEGLSWLATQSLQENPGLASDINLVAVDGFTAFTTSRRRFLQALAGQVGELLITLPAEPDSDRQLNRFAAGQLDLLQREFDAELIQRKANFLPATLKKIQQDIFEQNTEMIAHLEEPMLLELSSPVEEAREALRWLKGKHLREGVALDQMAIFVSDLERYRPLLNLVGSEFGIPLRFTAREKLASSPAIDAFLRFLMLPLEGYPSRTVLNLLGTPYFEFGFTNEQILQLDQIAVKQIIVSGRQQWDDSWKLLKASRNQEPTDQENEEEERSSGLQRLDIEILQERFEAFWHLFELIDASATLTGWTNWLESLLEQLHFYANLETEDDHDANRTLQNLLQSMVLSEHTLGERLYSYSDFVEMLWASSRSIQIAQSENQPFSAVFVDQIKAARANRYLCVALLGLNEGEFPVLENSDPFLGEEVREELGLELRLGKQQQSIFYQAITRTNRDLLLTRSYLNESGETTEESAYWKALAVLLPKDAIRKIHPREAQPQSEAGSLSEVLFWAAQNLRLDYPQLPEPAQRWERLLQAKSVINARSAPIAQGVFEGMLNAKAQDLEQQSWNATAFEAYADCPYRFFAAYPLRLEARKLPELGFDSAQLGTIYHEVLEQVYRQVLENRANPTEIVEEIARKVFQNAPGELGFRPSLLWQVQQEEMLRTLKENVARLEEKSDSWQPYALEYYFGRGWNPAVHISLEDGGDLLFRGRIDRIDRNEDGDYRVIDYKSSSQNISKIDLEMGKRLQLPLYALSLEDALEQGEVVDGFYWSIGGKKASSLSLANFPGGPSAAKETVKEHIRDIFTAMQAGQYPPQVPKNKCPDYCPAVRWCWRYQKRVSVG